MDTKIINNLRINTNGISESGAVRSFRINGDNNAKFMLLVAGSDSKYYDFSTDAFSTGHSSLKTLKGTLTGESFNGSIVFPGTAGVDYKVILMADPSDSTSMKKNSPIIKKISSTANTTLTISIDSTDHTASYATLPTDVTSSSGRTDIVSKAISWTVSNAATDANGFGLIRFGDHTKTRDLINDRCWYFQTTQDVNGATSSSKSITLDSVDDLIVGMVIYSGTGLSGTPTIRTVDAAAKTITLSTSQSISDGVTLTFRAIGLSLVNSVLDCTISPGLSVTDATIPTTTVRGVNNDAVIEVNGTRGIPGGDIAVISGNSVTPGSLVTANRTDASTATASESAGELTVTNTNVFKGGEKLDFFVQHPKFLFVSTVISGNVVISKQPTVDRTINFNLDEIFDPGTQA
tara:strand:+ start:1040 stop:2254 length:1215 start_codon:yes stop_codon:yes gene_type:complete